MYLQKFLTTNMFSKEYYGVRVNYLIFGIFNAHTKNLCQHLFGQQLNRK